MKPIATTGMPQPLIDQQLLQLRQRRRLRQPPVSSFLENLQANEFCDRLADVRRDFPVGIALGFITMAMEHQLIKQRLLATKLVRMDSYCFLDPAADGITTLPQQIERWPFRSASSDLIILADLANQLDRLDLLLGICAQILRPDGLLLGLLPAADCFAKLKQSLAQAELQHSGHVTSRFHPFIDMVSLGNKLGAAGLRLSVIEKSVHPLPISNVTDFARFMRANGIGNALHTRSRQFMTKTLLHEWQRQLEQLEKTSASAFYLENLIFLAWKPHPKQPQPLQPGSGKQPFASIAKKKPGNEHRK